MRSVRVAMMTLGALVLGSCGGDDGAPGGGSAACKPFTACGGVVTGAWKIAEACGLENAAMAADPDCPGSKVDLRNLKYSGDADFRADMSYRTSTILTGSAKLLMPKSCLSSGATMLSCKQIEGLFALFTASADSPIAGFTCAESGASCDCNMTFKPTPQVEAGTYRISGNQLITKPMNEAEEPSEYCVSGTELNIRDAMSSMMGSMGGIVDTSANITLRLVRP
jgi:hypothetical protein